jgi:hypothetical protein
MYDDLGHASFEHGFSSNAGMETAALRKQLEEEKIKVIFIPICGIFQTSCSNDLHHPLVLCTF